MNLIKFDEYQQAVDARELHDRLGITKRFDKWMSKMLTYGYEDGIDYIKRLEYTGGRPSTEYTLTLDTAKELCMLANTTQGRKIRKYFINCEKEYKKMYKELLSKKDQKLLKSQRMNKLLSDSINKNVYLCNEELYTVTEIASEYGLSAKRLNKILEDLKVQYHDGKVWRVVENYKNYVQYTCYDYADKDNNLGFNPLMKWTDKGKQFIDTIIRAYIKGGNHE